MKMSLSVVLLLVLLAGPARAQLPATVGLFGDTGSGLSRTIDPVPGVPFDVVAYVPEVLVMAAAEFVMTELAVEYPGVFKLSTRKINDTTLDLGDNARGEYLMAFGTCVRQPFEIVRVTYLDVGGFIPSDVALSLRGFQPGDTRPSTFNGEPGFIDCVFTGTGTHLFDFTVPALITASGTYVPPGGMVVNPTYPVIEVDTSSWFAFDLAPNTLNLASNGRKISIELTAIGPVALSEVDTEALELMGVPAIHNSVSIDDSANPPVLRAKFPREEVAAMLQMGMHVEVSLTGKTANGLDFTATDEIRVIDPRNVPPGKMASAVAPGSVVALEWQAISDSPGVSYDGYVSTDNGESWSLVFENVSETNQFFWRLDPSLRGPARVIVEGRHPIGAVHLAATAKFVIEDPVGEASQAVANAGLEVTASPNPFNPHTTIYFDLPAAANVDLVVYDLAGRRVKTLATGFLPAGQHRAPWNGRDESGRLVASGTYVCRLRAGNHVESERIMLLK
jgi:hypothetical protein